MLLLLLRWLLLLLLQPQQRLPPSLLCQRRPAAGPAAQQRCRKVCNQQPLPLLLLRLQLRWLLCLFKAPGALNYLLVLLLCLCQHQHLPPHLLLCSHSSSHPHMSCDRCLRLVVVVVLVLILLLTAQGLWVMCHPARALLYHLLLQHQEQCCRLQLHSLCHRCRSVWESWQRGSGCMGPFPGHTEQQQQQQAETNCMPPAPCTHTAASHISSSKCCQLNEWQQRRQPGCRWLRLPTTTAHGIWMQQQRWLTSLQRPARRLWRLLMLLWYVPLHRALLHCSRCFVAARRSSAHERQSRLRQLNHRLRQCSQLRC